MDEDKQEGQEDEEGNEESEVTTTPSTPPTHPHHPPTHPSIHTFDEFHVLTGNGQLQPRGTRGRTAKGGSRGRPGDTHPPTHSCMHAPTRPATHIRTFDEFHILTGNAER